MPEISKARQTIEWICRILITIDLYFVISGYINWFQARHQLSTPLIPQSILYEVTDTSMKAGIIAGIGLMAGLWFYFFQRRTIALILLAIAGLSHELILLFLKS